MWSGLSRLSNRSTDLPSSQHTNRPTSSNLTGTDPPATKQQSTSKSHSDQPQASDRPRASEQTGSDQPALQKPATSRSTFEPTWKDNFSSESVSGSVLSDRPPVDIYVEEGELSDEQGDSVIHGLDTHPRH